MSHPRSRAERRAALDRWKRRVRTYYGGHGAGDPRLTGLYATTRKLCSCWCCGNPRRHAKGAATMQEKRAA